MAYKVTKTDRKWAISGTKLEADEKLVSPILKANCTNVVKSLNHGYYTWFATKGDALFYINMEVGGLYYYREVDSYKDYTGKTNRFFKVVDGKIVETTFFCKTPFTKD